MENVVLGKAVGRLVSVICLNCKNQTRHKILTSVDTDGKEDMGDDDWFYWSNSHQVIECQGCGNMSFRSESSNSEAHYNEDGPDFDEHIYPRRTKSTWNAKNFYNIPPNLRRIYRETIDCYNNENLTLCGAGIRGLVEGLCNENGVINGEIEIVKPDGTTELKRVETLQGKINGLHEKGKLTKENADGLHEHRFLGNTAIHDLSASSKVDLALAIEIIEHVFDTVYEIPEKTMQLKYKRLKGKSS